jgi:hypothetical protein
LTLQKAAAIDARTPWIQEKLGPAYEQMRNLEETRSEIRVAILLALNILSLHFEMGRIYQKEGMISHREAAIASPMRYR